MNKKFAFMQLISLIILFLIVITLVFISNSEGSGDNSEVKKHIDELHTDVSDIKVQMDQWDSLINGDTSANIDLGDKEEKEEEEKNEPEVVEEEEEPEKDPEPEVKETTLTTNADNLNVRATPSTNANIVGTLNNGNKVTSEGNTQEANGYTWVEITMSNGNKGWAVQSFFD